jgi:hypothetical protein
MCNPAYENTTYWEGATRDTERILPTSQSPPSCQENRRGVFLPVGIAGERGRMLALLERSFDRGGVMEDENDRLSIRT